MRDLFTALGLGGFIGGLIIFAMMAPQSAEKLCTKSAAQVKLLSLCGEMDGCHYDKADLRPVLEAVAKCELAKIQENK